MTTGSKFLRLGDRSGPRRRIERAPRDLDREVSGGGGGSVVAAHASGVSAYGERANVVRGPWDSVSVPDDHWTPEGDLRQRVEQALAALTHPSSDLPSVLKAEALRSRHDGEALRLLVEKLEGDWRLLPLEERVAGIFAVALVQRASRGELPVEKLDEVVSYMLDRWPTWIVELARALAFDLAESAARPHRRLEPIVPLLAERLTTLDVGVDFARLGDGDANLLAAIRWIGGRDAANVLLSQATKPDVAIWPTPNFEPIVQAMAGRARRGDPEGLGALEAYTHRLLGLTAARLSRPSARRYGRNLAILAQAWGVVARNSSLRLGARERIGRLEELSLASGRQDDFDFVSAWLMAGVMPAVRTAALRRFHRLVHRTVPPTPHEVAEALASLRQVLGHAPRLVDVGGLLAIVDRLPGSREVEEALTFWRSLHPSD